MGGHAYQYAVPYQENAQAALDRLRDDVFQRGDLACGEHRACDPSHARDAASVSGRCLRRMTWTKNCCL